MLGKIDDKFPSSTLSYMIEGVQPYFGSPVKATPNTTRSVELDVNQEVSACYGILVQSNPYSRSYYEGDCAPHQGSDEMVLIEGYAFIRIQSAVKRDAQLAFTERGWVQATGARGYINVTAVQAGTSGSIIPVRIISSNKYVPVVEKSFVYFVSKGQKLTHNTDGQILMTKPKE